MLKEECPVCGSLRNYDEKCKECDKLPSQE
jgi:hypothetical protein